MLRIITTDNTGFESHLHVFVAGPGRYVVDSGAGNTGNHSKDTEHIIKYGPDRKRLQSRCRRRRRRRLKLLFYFVPFQHGVIAQRTRIFGDRKVVLRADRAEIRGVDFEARVDQEGVLGIDWIANPSTVRLVLSASVSV